MFIAVCGCAFDSVELQPWPMTVSVASREDVTSTPMKEKSQSATLAKGKGKGGKGKEKEKEKGSRPPSNQFDYSKPNWLLRVVSDASATVG